MFGGKFVLVIRGAYIRGAYIRGDYIRDFTVLNLKNESFESFSVMKIFAIDATGDCNF